MLKGKSHANVQIYALCCAVRDTHFSALVITCKLMNESKAQRRVKVQKYNVCKTKCPLDNLRCKEIKKAQNNVIHYFYPSLTLLRMGLLQVMVLHYVLLCVGYTTNTRLKKYISSLL